MNQPVWLISVLAALTTIVGCQKEPVAQSFEPQEARKITLLSWEEYFPEEVLANFTEATGIEIDYRSYENTDELEGLLSSTPDQFDIVLTDDHSSIGLINIKCFGELDRALLPNFKHLDARYQSLWFDPGNRFSTPYLMGTTLMVYNEAMVGEIEDPSWSLLWDQERVGDQPIFMIDEVDDYFFVALKKMGQNYNSANEEAIRKAAVELTTQARTMNVQYAPFPTIHEALIEGECAAAVLYSSEALSAVDENEDLVAVIPKEGALSWIDSFFISRESKNREDAHAFINYILDPKVSAECANFNYLATPNAKAMEYLDEELKVDPAVFPSPEVLANCEYLDDLHLKRAQAIYGKLPELRRLLGQVSSQETAE